MREKEKSNVLYESVGLTLYEDGGRLVAEFNGDSDEDPPDFGQLTQNIDLQVITKNP